MKALIKFSVFVGIIFLFFTCLTQKTFADKTYFGEGTETTQQLYAGDVSVNIKYGLSKGSFSGCINGILDAQVFMIDFQDPLNYKQYLLTMGLYQLSSGNNTYTGFLTAIRPHEEGVNYTTLYGEIGAVAVEDEAELTSIYGTQYSGHFTHQGIDNQFKQLQTTLHLTIEATSLTEIPLSGYYNGILSASGRSYGFSLENINWSELGLPSELESDELWSFIGTYDWNQTPEVEDGNAYIVGGLGSITGPLAGVFFDSETEETFIEHCGTAPPVPAPPAIWLLGSGLGILLLSTRKKKAN